MALPFVTSPTAEPVVEPGSEPQPPDTPRRAGARPGRRRVIGEPGSRNLGRLARAGVGSRQARLRRRWPRPGPRPRRSARSASIELAASRSSSLARSGPTARKALDHESGGRLDKLDLWLLVVLVVAVLGIRMFRLSEPYQMHFDEVYHARTGTEFLQDWRYGYDHDIYEWTHPHLAKYAMAGGLVAWGDDRVSATSDLGVPVRDAIIEPRRDDAAASRATAAATASHVVTGTELRSYDLLDRRLVYQRPDRRGVCARVRPDRLPALHRHRRRRRSSSSMRRVSTASRAPSSPALVAPPSAFGHVDGRIASMYATERRPVAVRRDR